MSLLGGGACGGCGRECGVCGGVSCSSVLRASGAGSLELAPAAGASTLVPLLLPPAQTLPGGFIKYMSQDEFELLL